MKATDIKQKANALGFDACGIAPIHELPKEAAALAQWLQEGAHGEMQYMERNLDKRYNPTLLVEGAQSVVSVLLNYYTPLQATAKGQPRISKYAYGLDYHYVIKDKLHQLLAYIKQIEPSCEGRAFVDSAPVLDRAWAQRAGLGWIGKNTMLINNRLGSYVFVGELIINITTEYDSPTSTQHCGSCSRCIDACPTGAIKKPYFVDARQCISYQTIEQRGEIDKTMQGKIGDWMYGCDICQDVCPWNNKCKQHAVAEFAPKAELQNMTTNDWLQLDKAKFKQLFKNTAVERAGLKGLRRNAEFISMLRR